MLTQDELLAEAAQTELQNLADLQAMMAIEEQTKKKAMIKKAKYSGPMIRYKSMKQTPEIGGEPKELVSDLLNLF